MDIIDSGFFYCYERYGSYTDDEMIDRAIEKQRIEDELQRKKEWDEKHNIHRDKRGRLNEGALLASKDNCNELAIQLRYDSGMTVKEITECMGCSKSTVYNAIKKHRCKKP